VGKIKTYYTGGTVGDAYIILCKLYSVAVKEPILCRHYTRHANVRPVIKEIYGLVPNIKVEFLSAPLPGVRMSGAFQNCVAEDTKYGIDPEYYPEFEFDGGFVLPKAYKVLQMAAGREQERKLGLAVLEEVLEADEVPVVIVGMGGGAEFVKGYGVVDLRGETSIRQVVGVIKNSNHFYGPQGFLSYVAVSQKVLSTVFVQTRSDEVAIRARVEAVEQWRKYLVGGWIK